MTRILLVDDDNRQRKLCSVILEDAGYTVDAAANASEAIRAARVRRPDVIVSDVMMDEIDGFGLCRRLQDDSLLARIPVVLVSAHYDDPSARELAKTLGAAALIERTPDFSAELASITSCVEVPPPRPSRPSHEAYEAHLETNAKQLTKLLEQTRRAELRWRKLFEHAHEVLCLLTVDGIIMEVNQRWQTVLGVAPRDAIGRHFLDFSALGHLEAHQTEFQKLLHNGEAETTVAARHANGSTVWMDMSASLIDVDGAVHALVIGRDVTQEILRTQRLAEAEAERKKLEERLAHAQRLETIGQLTGGIAHDFNNILAAILTSADVLVEDLADADPRRGDAETIRDSARRAVGLTRQLLAFSRKQKLELRNVDVAEAVRSVSKMLRRLIGARIDLQIKEEEPVGLVHADAVQLEQVIVNLAVNARDAMPSGGTLTITTSQVSFGEHGELPCGTYMKIAVADTGCGMTRETMQHLFEPFFTTKDRETGTGLGLSTSYGIVKQLGGDILATSSVGVGTTMTVYLPVVPDKIPPA